MKAMMAHRNKSWLLLTAFASVYFFWGSAFVANRYGVQMVHPAVLAGIRYVVAGGLLLLYVLLRGNSVRINGKDLFRVTGLGLIMFTCNTVLLGYGSRQLSAGVAALVIATIPLFIAVVERILPHGAKMSALGWIGTTTGFVGLGVLSKGSVQGVGSCLASELAFGALLVAALAWAVGSVLTSRMVFQASTIVCIGWQMMIGGVIDLLIGLALGGFQASQFTAKSVTSIAYLSVFCTLVGFTSYMYLLRNVKLATAATYAYVNPLVAVFLGWLFLHEGVRGSEWVGVALVLFSVAVVIGTKPATRAPAAEI